MTQEKNLIGKEILNYRIERFLGGGGMGSVYLAANMHINEKVAIKVLNENLVESAIVRQKFVKEAETLLRLSHQNIVQYRNFVENEDGVFLIMEYVDGITLDDFINQKQGVITEDKAYPMFSQILDAFSYAHKQGIVHRDIKPANIILTSDNEGNFVVKVLDFGIARIISESNESEKGMIIGTPMYMSPEQVQGTDVDGRSDVYSLGVLLHQMLTGRAPYDATTLSETEILNKVVQEPLPKVKQSYSDHPNIDRLQSIIDRATQKDAAKRYQSCGDFRTALKNIFEPEKLPKIIKYAAAALVLLLLGGGWWFWDYNRVKVSYYKDYVEQWGVPVGVGKLSKSEFEHRTASYKFYSSKGKIDSVFHVNCKGNTVEHNDSEHTERYDAMLLYYTENGKVDYVKRMDRNGKVLYRMDYDENLKIANFTQDDDTKTELNLSANTTKLFASAFSASNEKSRISKYLFTYNENGYLTQVKYASGKLPQVCDAEGIYGKKYLVDEKGRVIEEHYLGKDNEPKANGAGLAIKKLEYDNNDDFVKVSYFTAGGEKGYDGNGCHICALEYDQYGNRIKETYYDSDEKITLRTDGKIAGYDYIVENGLTIQQTAFDLDGAKCYVSKNALNENDDMFGYASIRLEYDANGYISKISFFDTEDKPVMISTGIAAMSLENDSKGNCLIQTYLDTENLACKNIYGFSKSIAEYDSLGNHISVTFKDAKDKLCKTQNGTAGFRSEYDTRGRLVKQIFIGTDGKPCESTDGIVIYFQEYDPTTDNLKKVSFYAANGKSLKLSGEEIAGWESEYNQDGYEIERAFFDTKGNPTAGNLTFARWKNKYDENGFLKESAYFDVNGSPVKFNNQYSKVEYVYDSKKGNKIEEIWYEGNVKKQIFRYTYDKSDLVQSEALFSGNGSKILNSNGYHKVEYAYNNRRQITEQRYYNTGGELTLIPDGAGLYAIHRNEYDRLGRISRQTYFDENKNPTPLSLHVPEGLTGYDKHGNMNYLASADGKGKVIDDPKQGCAYKEMKHNTKGLVIEERFYNANKKLLQKCTTDYDKKGVETRTCYDADNNLIGTEKIDRKTGNVESDQWRQYWKPAAANCPFQIDYGIICTSISLTSGGCVLHIQFAGIEKYQQTAEELENCKDFARKFIAAEKPKSQMPPSATFTVVGIDKDKRELFRVTK